MESKVYTYLLKKISDIDSDLYVYQLSGYPDTDELKDRLISQIVELNDASKDLDSYLDSTFIEKLYVNYLSDKIIANYNLIQPQESLEKQRFARLRVMCDSTLFYAGQKRNIKDHSAHIEHKDDLLIFYLGTLFSIVDTLEKAIPETKKVDVIPDTLFKLDGYNEKLLFIKHSGIYDALKEKYTRRGNPHKIKIASIIAYLINEKSVETIEGKLGFLDNPEKKGANNPYNEKSVINTIKALDDATKEVDPWLLDFSKRYYKES